MKLNNYKLIILIIILFTVSTLVLLNNPELIKSFVITVPFYDVIR